MAMYQLKDKSFFLRIDFNSFSTIGKARNLNPNLVYLFIYCIYYK
ncbi:hypothetical protein DsansV1_C25g0189601 [Dioscorea sansibarensis]